MEQLFFEAFHPHCRKEAEKQQYGNESAAVRKAEDSWMLLIKLTTSLAKSERDAAEKAGEWDVSSRKFAISRKKGKKEKEKKNQGSDSKDKK